MGEPYRCEECGKEADPCSYDYCATCFRDLCDDCMARGCCGVIPAKSGDADDDPAPARGAEEVSR